MNLPCGHPGGVVGCAYCDVARVNPGAARKWGVVPAALRPPCRHEGDVVSWCPKGDEALHERRCLNDSGPDTCTRKGVCAGCRWYESPSIFATGQSAPEGVKAESRPGGHHGRRHDQNGPGRAGHAGGGGAPVQFDGHGRIVARFDHHNLWPKIPPISPNQPSLRFNPSLLAMPDGSYLFAFRTGWAGSEIWVGRLGADMKPVGEPAKLELRHPMASHGREDPILTMHAGRPHLVYVGVTNPPLRTNVLYARLSEDGMRAEAVFHPEYRRRKEWEKSWVPFSHGDTLYAVYSFAPETRIVRLDGNKATTAFSTRCDVPYQHGEVRGGASPTRIGDELFFFCHSHTYPIGSRFWRQYHTLVVTLDARPPFRLRRITPVPLSSADPKTRTRPRKGPAVFFVRGAVLIPDSPTAPTV